MHSTKHFKVLDILLLQQQDQSDVDYGVVLQEELHNVAMALRLIFFFFCPLNLTNNQLSNHQIILDLPYQYPKMAFVC
jgi:hypothetical protein